LVTIEVNDVLPCVPIFDYLKYNNNYYFEKKNKTFNSNAGMILYYDMWPNVSMPCGIKEKSW
jgi:hypothetical protein